MTETNTCFICDKLRETASPGPVIAPIKFMGKNTFVCTSYEGQLSDEWNGLPAGALFSFCLNKVISDSSMLPVGCTLNCSKLNMLGYAEVFFSLVAVTAQTLQMLVNAPTSNLSILSV